MKNEQVKETAFYKALPQLDGSWSCYSILKGKKWVAEGDTKEEAEHNALHYWGNKPIRNEEGELL